MLVTVLIVSAARAVVPWDKMLPDFLCYWTAGRLVAEGRSPYDPDGQMHIQHQYGWDREQGGRGVLDFLPFYYPPWFAAACAVLVPLGFNAAKTVWLFLNTWLLLASAVQFRGAVPGVPRSVPLAVVPLFLLSIQAVVLGQTAVLILFLVALAWGLLERGRDRAGGAALAAIASKPQLAAVLVLSLLIWAGRHRRWGVVQGFLVTLAALSLLGWLIVPWWPLRMLEATRRNPPPTVYFPWIGTSWLLVLRTLGLRSWMLGTAYLAGAVPLVVATLRAALDRARPLRETIALSLLAAFFLAPYARAYDFPVLLIPFLVLVGDRLSERASAALLMAIVLVPYVQFFVLTKYRRLYTTMDFILESTWFWIPLLLAVTWFATRARTVPPATVLAQEQKGGEWPVEGQTR